MTNILQIEKNKLLKYIELTRFAHYNIMGERWTTNHDRIYRDISKEVLKRYTNVRPVTKVNVNKIRNKRKRNRNEIENLKNNRMIKRKMVKMPS